MACFDETIQCDMCGDFDPVWTKFCLTCGLDVCDKCKLTHAAHHEFADEANQGVRY